MKKGLFILSLLILALVISIVVACSSYETPLEPTDTTYISYGGMRMRFPVIRLDTYEGNPLESRHDWLRGNISIESAVMEHTQQNMSGRMRGRGNSTWRRGTDKRPLRFRLDEPGHVLGSPYAHRDWILLASHFDRSLFRDYFALHLAELMDGLDFTPSAQFVHLFVNSEYMGVYQLTDERDIAPGRAMLTFDEDPAVSEYFLEFDRHSLYSDTAIEGEDYFMVYGRAIDLRWPGSGLRSDGHFKYAHGFVDNLSRTIRSQDWDAIKRLIDIPSFVDFYIVQELMKNNDIGWFSVFMTIRGQGEDRKMFMGPVWDFDQSSGNTENRPAGEVRTAELVVSPEGLFAGAYNYWYRYLLDIPEFYELVARRFAEVVNTEVAAAIQHVRDMYNEYFDDFDLNFQRHPICLVAPPSWIWILADVTQEIDSFSGHVEYFLDWLNARVEWFSEHFVPGSM